MMAVSPFDGANRIRFKGSPSIADFRLPIADLPARHSSNPQSEISNPQSVDSQPFGSPENFLLVNVFNCRPTQMQSPKSKVQCPMSNVRAVQRIPTSRAAGPSKTPIKRLLRTLDIGHWTLDCSWTV